MLTDTDLVPTPGTRSYPIVDYFGDEREVFLYPGKHGFIYYRLGDPKESKYKKIIKDGSKDAVNNLIKGIIILGGGAIIIITGAAS